MTISQLVLLIVGFCNAALALYGLAPAWRRRR